MRAGFATTCITPPLGKEIPGLFERRFAEGIHDPLFARAVVVEDERHCAALVQTDCLFLRNELVAAARKAAHRLCGIPGDHCLIAATHTHSGGPVFHGFQSENDPAYEAYLVEQIASAIAEAHRNLRPAEAGIGKGVACGVAYNRRFVMADGTHRTHPGKMNPDIAGPAGPEDPAVTVIAFREPGTEEPFGCLINFACHATHMNGLLYSADYPRWIADTVQAMYGLDFGCVYLNGACGDVTQVDNRSPRPMEFGEYWCRRSGRIIGAEAIKVIESLAYAPGVPLANATRRLKLAIRESAPAELRAARAYLAGNRNAAPKSAVFDDALFKEEVGGKQQKKAEPLDVEAIFARALLEVETRRRREPAVPVEIQAVRIGDALIWSVPGELFQAFALDVRAKSPFPFTCCAELANGYAGYICTPDAFTSGGYEVRTAPSSLLHHDAGNQIVRTALAMANTLWNH